ncbi:MAG: DUF559 domain-containing protein [Clostridia bacterium]|nr:DUF559 domain-containing protein [Clostridia bacterium]
MLPYNKNLTQAAQKLRKNMTKEEKHLWYDFLKFLPMTVKRQKNFENYIIDFYIPQAKIAIEIDGVQHTADEHFKADAERDHVLAEWGIKVLRYYNFEINSKFEEVTQNILNNLGLNASDMNR